MPEGFTLERIIHQDARHIRKVFAVYVPASTMFLVGGLMFFVYWLGQRNIQMLWEGGAILACTWALFCGTIGFVIMRPRTQWAIDDNGLMRTLPGGGPERVHWDQIHRMKSSPLGLAIRWRDNLTNAAHRHESPKEHSSFLYVDKNDAEELIRTWRICVKQNATAGRIGSKGPT
jgi:hypothetical protein